MKFFLQRHPLRKSEKGANLAPATIRPVRSAFRRARFRRSVKGLREKQKVKRFYGVMEEQFRRYFAEASRHQVVTPANR